MRGKPVGGLYKHGILWLWLTGLLAMHGVVLAQSPEPSTPSKASPTKPSTSGAPSTPSDPSAPAAAADSTSVPSASSETTTSSKAATPEPGKDSAVPTAVEMNASTYAVKLRDLEQRINELKEQIFRSKARLSLLAETVLQGVVAGSQAVITHENHMSSSYRLVKAVYALDGAPIFSKADEEGSLGEQEAVDVYYGSIVPGEHTLTVNLEYQGYGFGVFSYLKGYRFKVRSNHTFTAPEGKGISVRVIAYEKGGPTAPLQDRPAIRFTEKVTSARRGAQGPEGRGAD